MGLIGSVDYGKARQEVEKENENKEKCGLQ